jgi:hypothetical protein
MSLSVKILAWGLLLTTLLGCASQQVSVFTPFTPVINNHEAFDNDLIICRGYSQEYLSGRASVEPSQVLQEGVRAGFGDLGYSAISPTAPALGALGGASGEIISELGLNSLEAKKIVSWCMHDRGQILNNYSVYDPNL